MKYQGKKYKVTEIAPKACKGMKKLKTLKIGKNVKTIGSKAVSKIGSVPTVKCPKGKSKDYAKLLKKGGLKKANYSR